MKQPVFITSNPAKAAQLSQYLNLEIQHKSLDLPEIQSLRLEEIIEQKAKAAFEIIKAPVLVEDTSLIFNALGKLPGPLIKWFLTELDNEGLCRILDGYAERGAIASTLFGLYDGQTLYTFSGEMKGAISEDPKGSQGFGWDPIFIPYGTHKTWSEMTDEERSHTSMRGIALKELEEFLIIQTK